MTGTVLRIERFAIHDGPGIRTTVFLKGCPLRCLWCHSPESQSPRPEFMPLPDRCIACATCVPACPEHVARPLAVRGVQNATVSDLTPGEVQNATVSDLTPGEVQNATVSDLTPARREKRNTPVPDPAEVKNAAVSDLTPGEVQNATVSDLTPGRCRVCGRCVEACPTGARVIAGEEMTVDAVIDAVERDHLFYDESGGGVTFSGGEPLMQAAFVAALVNECRTRGIHTAVDTSGFGDPTALDSIRPNLFLFDLKAIDEARHREITGVSNRVILENFARLAERGRRPGDPEVPPSPKGFGVTVGPSDLIVRFPLVPGVTDGDENVAGIGREVSSLGIARIDVLPYHRAGLAKYDRLGRPYALRETQPPTTARLQHVARILSDWGLTVRVGGG